MHFKRLIRLINRHIYLPAMQRVVDIGTPRRIDRAHVQSPQIDPFFQIPLSDGPRQVLGQAVQHGLREYRMRHVVFE